MLGHGLCAWWMKEGVISAFLLSGCSAIFLGGATILSFSCKPMAHFSLHESFFLTVVSWVLVSYVAALPLYFANLCPKMLDCVFESVSALTATGLSVVPEASYFCSCLKFWRVFLQWFGGFGIIMAAVVFLPILRLGGSQLMSSESSDRSEKIAPRTATMAACLAFVYIFLTVLCALCLKIIVRLPLWDSVTYAMSVISTGGIAMSQYGVTDLTVGAKIILSVGMMLGATTLVLVFYGLRGNWRALTEDDQVRGMGKILLFTLLGVTLWHQEKPFIDSIFMTVSAISGAGFSTDSFHFGGFFWIITLIGGCSGSAAGGIKVFRLQIIYRMAKNHVLRCLNPGGFYVTVYNKKPVDRETIDGVMAIVFFYLAGWGLFTVALTMCGYVLGDAVTLASSALTNSGLPLGNWAHHGEDFSSATKWVVMVTMICGRLEFVAVVGLFWAFFRNKPSG
jgi:trk system potassium uptake protein TrkH